MSLVCYFLAIGIENITLNTIYKVHTDIKTLLKAMGFLKEQGATKVICATSLPFFTGNAIEQFDEAYKQGLFYRIIGTNAVYHEDLLNKEWYINTDVSGLFANVITRIHYNQSLSELLDNRNIIEKVVKQNNYSADKESK